MLTLFPVLVASVLSASSTSIDSTFPARQTELAAPTVQAAAGWGYQIKDPNQLVADVTQPGYQELARGGNDQLMYAVFQFNRQLVIVIVPRTGGTFASSSFSCKDTDKARNALPSARLADLLVTHVKGPMVDRLTITNAYSLYGYVIPCPASHPESLHVAFHGISNKKVAGKIDLDIPLASASG